MQYTANLAQHSEKDQRLSDRGETTYEYIERFDSVLASIGEHPSALILRQHFNVIEALFAEYLEWVFIHRVQTGLKDQVEIDDALHWSDRIERETRILARKKREQDNLMGAEDSDSKLSEICLFFQPRTIALYKYYKEHPTLHDDIGNHLINKVVQYFIRTDELL